MVTLATSDAVGGRSTLVTVRTKLSVTAAEGPSSLTLMVIVASPGSVARRVGVEGRVPPDPYNTILAGGTNVALSALAVISSSSRGVSGYFTVNVIAPVELF